MGMARGNNPDLIRAATSPTPRARSDGNTRQHNKKAKTISERLRSTFGRSKHTTNNVAKKCSDEIIYGKIVVLGQAGVGKTSFIHRLVNNYFTEKYTPTTTSASFEVTAIVECEEAIKAYKSRKDRIIDYAKSVKKTKSLSRANISEQLAKQNCNTKTFRFQLVDTTDDINETSPMEYRSTVANAHGFLLVCSSDKKGSIRYIRDIYNDIAAMRKNTTVPVIIIQNKDDLHTGSEDDEAFDAELEQLAVSLDVATCQLSTANSSGFENLTELLLNDMNVYNEDYQTELALPDEVAYSDQTEKQNLPKVISNKNVAGPSRMAEPVH